MSSRIAFLAALSAVAAGIPVPRATVTVRMTAAHAFEPRVVTVRPGDEVLWTNDDRAVHSVVGDPWLALHRIDVEPPAPPEPFHSEDLGPGRSYRRTFELEGVYRYVCPHYEEEGMNGTVLVERPGKR